MTWDVVNELREIQVAWVEQFGADSGTDTIGVAADEIERLRTQLAAAEAALVNAQAQLVAQHPEAWARITKRLADERDEARAAAEAEYTVDVITERDQLRTQLVAAEDAAAKHDGEWIVQELLQQRLATARGLLKEALTAGDWWGGTWEMNVTAEWFERAKKEFGDV